jgi:hypothetical protein
VDGKYVKTIKAWDKIFNDLERGRRRFMIRTYDNIDKIEGLVLVYEWSLRVCTCKLYSFDCVLKSNT